MIPHGLRAATCGLLLFALADVPRAEARETIVDVWFNAFIPNGHPKLPDYIRKTRKNTFVISAPDFIGALKDSCFETDNREFSDAPLASARIAVSMRLRLNGREMIVEPIPGQPQRRVGVTHNVDCITGEERNPSKSAPSDRLLIGDVKESQFSKVLYIDAAGANPFYPSIRIPGTNRYLGASPDIDFKVVLTYRYIEREIEMKGSIGYFPSFEGYYRINSGPAQAFYRMPPHENATALDLVDFSLGINTRNVTAKVALP